MSAATVQRLRLLTSLDPEAGLTAESLAYAMLQGSEEHARWRAANRQPARSDEGRVAVVRQGEAGRFTLRARVNQDRERREFAQMQRTAVLEEDVLD